MKNYFIALITAAILGLASVNLAGAAPPLEGGGAIHYVGFGETLSSISARYGVSMEAILRHNGLANPNMIYVGQPLMIPGGANSPAQGYGCGGTVHTVVPGETLSGIAYSYGVSLQDLISYNSLYNQDMVYSGQQLCVPAAMSYAPQPGGYQSYSPAGSYYHTVAAGETLHGIAEHYRCSYDELVRLNNVQNSSFIMVGQRLAIPGYQPFAPPTHAYAPPPAPPSKPAYNDSYDHSYLPPKEKYPPKDPPKPSYGGVPPAPDYQPVPVGVILPLADHPLEVLVNGGMNWVGQVFQSGDDPNQITTLIVSVTNDVKPGEDAPVVRLQSGDYEVKGDFNFVPEFGIDRPRFVFRYIPPGDYDVWLQDDAETLSEVVRVKVKAGQRVEVGFEKGLLFSGPKYAGPDGWFLADWSNPSVPGQRLGGWSNILVHTPASGLNVLIESEGGGYQAKCFTGSKGPGSCDFAALNAGFYLITIEGTGYTVKTYMDGNAYATFTFGRQATGKEKGKVGPVSYD
jgi:LysM repeat protein